ncbi:MAG: M61 family metallopeptidase [Asticcacaulis sp.]
MTYCRSVSLLALAAALVAAPALAQVAAPPSPAIPAARDEAYTAGTIRLSVDATDTLRKLIRIHEVFPVNQAGDFVVMAPKWLPGDHEPDGEADKMAGFVFTADGKPVPWVRDPVAVNAFHVQVPPGVKEIGVDFQYLAPVNGNVGRIVFTPDMVNVQWTFASLYPAGYFVSRLPVVASLKLPAGWQLGSGLDVEAASADNTITFKPVSYETLIDSPVFAGRYFKQLDLDPGARVPVHMDIVADKADMLDVPDDVVAIHRKLVQQAYKLYGSHHYDHYDFLVAASDNLGDIGLEHHRSSENSVDTEYFTDWKSKFYGRDLFAHEYTHSWNGKFRRPWDLWTPDYQTPMRDSLLWVYEGQTEYWGNVLAARSGLFDKEQYLGRIANLAGYYDNLAARQWRDLEDTTNDPIIAQREAQSWPNWQASEEYYDQGLLIWLDADTLIREKTKGAKSLDDFARAFFGINDGAWDTVTYGFDDVVKALNAVYPYDWASFLNARLHDHGEKPPFDGLTRAGYRLVYTDTPTSYFKARETQHKLTDLSYSLGLALDKGGVIKNVLWEGPAFKAGLTIGEQVVAVNSFVYDADALTGLIKTNAQPGNTDSIELLVKANDRYRTVRIDYHGGLRYPKLERIPGTPDMLAEILAEKK